MLEMRESTRNHSRIRLARFASTSFCACVDGNGYELATFFFAATSIQEKLVSKHDHERDSTSKDILYPSMRIYQSRSFLVLVPCYFHDQACKHISIKSFSGRCGAETEPGCEMTLGPPDPARAAEYHCTWPSNSTLAPRWLWPRLAEMAGFYVHYNVIRMCRCSPSSTE